MKRGSNLVTVEMIKVGSKKFLGVKVDLPKAPLLLIKNNKIKESGVMYAFIDSSNLWAAQKLKGMFLDYKKILKYIEDKFEPSLIKVFIMLLTPRKAQEAIA